MSLIETTTHATPRRCWLRGTVVQRRYLASKLSLSRVRPVADT